MLGWPFSCIHQSPTSLLFILLFSSGLFQVCDVADDPHGDVFIDDFGWLRCTGREYAAADARWGTADATIVSLELLTVFGAGPLAALIVYQIVKRDPARHYWIVVLSTAELYGGYVFIVYSIFFWWGTELRNEISGAGWW